MTDPQPKRKVALDQRIAKWVARGIALTPISPNMVTGLSIPIGFIAAWLLSEGGVQADFGAGLFVIVVWLDHVDGELARATGTSSEFGHYFDHVAALLNYVMMFVGAGLGVDLGLFGGWGLWLGIGAGVGVASIMIVRIYGERIIGRSYVEQTVRAGFEIEDTLYIVAPITWLGVLEYFILLAGIGVPLFLLYTFWDLFRALGRRDKDASCQR